MALSRDGQFKIETLPIIGGYNKQRFSQWSPEDTANHYVVKGENTKRPYAMYPTMGRAHINYLGFNQLIFGTEPRALFKSINFAYVVDGNAIYKIDSEFNQVNITAAVPLLTTSGPVYFAFLVVNTIVFACFVDDQKIYIYREDTNVFSIVTDPNAPGNAPNTKPGVIASFGNRITVSVANSSQFFLSRVNLDGNNFNKATCFTINDTAVFAQEDGIIRQMGVLNNTLYIFTDYITGVWSNIAAIFSGTGVSFPWKKSSTYNWNFGIANPSSLDIDFGYLFFLARNSDGLLQFMATQGGQPEVISSKAIDTMLQRYTNALGGGSPFLSSNSNGFLYQYENNIFYRFSGGPYYGAQLLDQDQYANSVEFNFENKVWHRCIELNGERNRIKYHVYFNFKHLVTVVNENTVYNMSGQFYYNEVRNSVDPDPQSPTAYVAYPFRYERITPIISQPDYSEFETEYVEIDFVFGDSNINFSISPFMNAQFLIDENPIPGSNPPSYQYMIAEQSDSDDQPVFILGDSGNTPTTYDLTYNYLFNPNISLYWSDDGGKSFQSADNREFSQMGVYQWKMRWYQLGPSRNRVYKLVCVSVVPVIILGGVMNIRRMSGGAN